MELSPDRKKKLDELLHQTFDRTNSVDAIARGDAAGALALYADDAVIDYHAHGDRDREIADVRDGDRQWALQSDRLSPLFRAAQTGLTQNYALVMVFGLLAAVAMFFGADIMKAFRSFFALGF